MKSRRIQTSSFILHPFLRTILDMRLILSIIGSLGWLAATFAASSSRSMDEAFEALRNPDPQIRATATKQIESLGLAARPALIEASQAHDRQIAGQAAEMLMKLPFFREDDPASIRALLADYHTQPAEQRELTILGSVLRVNEAPELICRLMMEDPDDQIAWSISDVYAGQRDVFWKPLFQCDFALARPAVRATLARGLFFSDRAKARELLKEVVTEEENYPTAPPEKLHEMYRLLAADAQVNGRLSEALHYQRRAAEIPLGAPVTVDGDEVNEISPLTSLLAFYAGVGMIDGFGDDLADHWEEIPRPENLYGLSRVFSCPGLTPISAAFERLGDASLPADIADRIAIGESLAEHQWISPAVRILQDATRRSVGPAEDALSRARQWRCAYTLYALAKESGDDIAAIKYTQDMIKMFEGAQTDASPKALEARVLGHQIHAARHTGDKAALKKLTAECLRTMDASLLDADSGAELVNALREIGEVERARIEFEKLFQQHQEAVTQSDEAPQELNNLAWLCAGVGEKKDLAVDAAERAIRAQPAEYGSIDTAALANFRAGKIDRAIELETFALALHPNDLFLIRQLEMFRKAKKR